MTKYNWRSFEEARKFVHGLKLKSISEWYRYCKSGKKPDDIPTTPYRPYTKQGKWKGWEDWLNITIIATQDREYRSFEEAKKFVHKLNLKSRTEWEVFAHSGKKPDDIPTNPWNRYKKEWSGMGDFLGSGVVAPKDMEFWEFEEAKKFVKDVGLKGKKDWEVFCRSGKRPPQLPSAPSSSYKKEWKGWGDFFGTGRIQDQQRKYRSFREAKKFVQKLNLNGVADWRNYCNSGKKPDDIPSNPNNTYKKQGTWTSWGDFLGTGNISARERSKNFMLIKNAKITARKLAKELGITTRKEWMQAYRDGKIPDTLPLDITQHYGHQKRKKK